MDEALKQSLLARSKKSATAVDAQPSPKNQDQLDKMIFPDCAICSDKSTGKHYKVYSCEGCKNFFRRSVRNKCRYRCPAYGTCPVERDQRTRCKACRMKKCLVVGMKKEAVQCERKPLVLLRRQAAPDDASDSPSSPEGNSNEALLATPSAGPVSSTKTNPSQQQEKRDNQESLFSRRTEEAASHHQANKATSTEHMYRSGGARDELLCASIPFHIDQPAMAMTEVGYLYEIASRMLFATVDWARGLVAFNCLCEQDRMRLVVEKWGSLFAIGMAECAEMFPLSTLLALTTNGREGDKKYYSPLLGWHTFQKLKTLILNGAVIGKFDKKLYEHIKIVTLFDQALSGLLEIGGIAETRRRAQIVLEEMLADPQRAQTSGDVRERIIAVLESAHDLNTQEITEVFFAPIVKETSVEFILGASLLGVKGVERCMANSTQEQ